MAEKKGSNSVKVNFNKTNKQKNNCGVSGSSNATINYKSETKSHKVPALVFPKKGLEKISALNEG